MIKAIDTDYKGYKFRSRLEARWAVFFDVLGIEWEYEKEGYELGAGERYLPDFALSGIGLRDCGNKDGVWAEVKPRDQTSCGKLERLVEMSKKDGILLSGQPGDQWQYGGMGDGHYQYKYRAGSDVWWDNCMYFMKCYTCGAVKIEFLEGNYMVCESCQGTCDDGHPSILKAIWEARSARFEFNGKAHA